jgi:hypothetical protein
MPLADLIVNGIFAKNQISYQSDDSGSMQHQFLIHSGAQKTLSKGTLAREPAPLEESRKYSINSHPMNYGAEKNLFASPALA